MLPTLQELITQNPFQACYNIAL